MRDPSLFIALVVGLIANSCLSVCMIGYIFIYRHFLALIGFGVLSILFAAFALSYAKRIKEEFFS